MTEAGTVEATSVAAVTTPELEALWHTANAYASSGKIDSAFTAKDTFAQILAGRELGLSPYDSIVNMVYLGGVWKPKVQIQGAMLKAYVGPDGERFDYRAERADDQCYVEILRREPGQKWEQIGEVVYTIADAKLAELDDSSEFWRMHPRKMLFWRGLGEAIEAYAPHTIHPVHLPSALVHGALGFADAATEADLPVADSDPAATARGEDAHPETAAGWLSVFTNILNGHEKRGTTDRIVEALDAAGAPAGDTLLARFAGLPDGNAAHEVVYRLDRNRPRRRQERADGNGHADA